MAQVTVQQAMEKLQTAGSPFVQLFAHGSLQVELYKPDTIDYQQPHSRDEVYVVVAGSGQFFCGDKTVAFSAGDFLFVPAGAEHRFIDFSSDFSTWVFFYGPEGGEQ